MHTTRTTQVSHDGLELVVHVHEPADGGSQGRSDDPPVLALHGFPQTHRCWDEVVVGLVSSGRRVLVPELRGYSPTARPADDAAYGLGPVVSDVVAVLDHAGLDQVDLLGHDWGAVAAWGATAEHPERVRSLVAVSVPHPRAFASAIAENPDQQQRSAYLRLFAQSGPGHAYRAEQVLLADDARRLRALYAPLPENLVGLHTAGVSDRETLTGALGWYRAMDEDELLAVPPVTVPTTFVWGAEDVAIGRVAAQRCAEHVQAPYRLVALDGVSHWVPEQDPGTLVRAVLEPSG